MAALITPPLDDGWPTLGDQVADWIEAHGCYGPGDLAGQPYDVTPEFRAQLQRAYQVFPKGHRLAGRRRFKQCYLEERKGTAKTERAMLVAFAESSPSGPVRCDGFDAKGVPVGIPVQSPYIPLVSYTVEQTEDLGYNVLRFIVESSDLADDYDVGLERIIVLDGRGKEAGKVVALAGSPNARDGARTSFQHFDEPHRMTLPRLKKARTTMVENTYKRVMADAWTLYTSTAGEPGEESVAEELRAYAEAVHAGKVDDPRLFFFSRQCPDEWPMDTPDDVRSALIEASGPNASWSGDIDALVSRWFEPSTDRAYYRRVWLNQWVSGSSKAHDVQAFEQLARPDVVVPDGTLVTLGFDGARRFDSTALYGVVVESGHVFRVGVWERPVHADEDWYLESAEVTEAIDAAFDRWDVWRLYGDPPYWDEELAQWASRFGKERVHPWWTNRLLPMAHSLRRWDQAIREGQLTHDGDQVLVDHVGNARRKELHHRTDDGEPLWVIRKERADSPRKIDADMAACLAWEARSDALVAGALNSRRGSRSRQLVTF